MESPRNLLHGLLGYIQEHTKKVVPRSFRLTSSSGYVRKREALTKWAEMLIAATWPAGDDYEKIQASVMLCGTTIVWDRMFFRVKK